MVKKIYVCRLTPYSLSYYVTLTAFLLVDWAKKIDEKNHWAIMMFELKINSLRLGKRFVCVAGMNSMYSMQIMHLGFVVLMRPGPMTWPNRAIFFFLCTFSLITYSFNVWINSRLFLVNRKHIVHHSTTLHRYELFTYFLLVYLIVELDHKHKIATVRLKTPTRTSSFTH